MINPAKSLFEHRLTMFCVVFDLKPKEPRACTGICAKGGGWVICWSIHLDRRVDVE